MGHVFLRLMQQNFETKSSYPRFQAIEMRDVKRFAAWWI